MLDVIDVIVLLLLLITRWRVVGKQYINVTVFLTHWIPPPSFHSQSFIIRHQSVTFPRMIIRHYRKSSEMQSIVDSFGQKQSEKE